MYIFALFNRPLWVKCFCSMGTIPQHTFQLQQTRNAPGLLDASGVFHPIRFALDGSTCGEAPEDYRYCLL